MADDMIGTQLPLPDIPMTQDDTMDDFNEHDEPDLEAVANVIASIEDDGLNEDAYTDMGESSVEPRESTSTSLGDTKSIRTHEADELDNDSSTLFVGENEGASPSPQTNQQALTRTVSAALKLAQSPPKPAKKLTLFARIRQGQKEVEESRNAARRQAVSQSYLSTLDDETYLDAVMPGSTLSGSTSRPTADEEAMEDRRAIAEFERKKRPYDELKSKHGKLPFQQDVEYMQLCAAENARKRKRQLDSAKAQEDFDEKMSMFPSGRRASGNDGEDADEGNGDNRRPRKRSMVDAELQRLQSMRVAFENEDSGTEERGSSATGQPGPSSNRGGAKAKKGKAKTGPKKPGPKKLAAKGGRMTAKKKKERDMAVRQASSLFNSDVFTQQANADAPEQPTFKSKVKDDALKELIASLPLDNQKQARGDMSTLLAATKDFDGVGACKSDGAGQWKVKGMLTSLKAYQVLGAAFMRRRENGENEPRGGLLADQMGLGKTVQTLANIVNGRPPKEYKGPKTTLIVAAPALLSQWMSEIERHTDCNFTILRYGALYRNQPPEILTRYDIVLATYHEVAASLPKNEPPVDCATAEQKIAWWKHAYETSRGPLHRTMFLR